MQIVGKAADQGAVGLDESCRPFLFSFSSMKESTLRGEFSSLATAAQWKADAR